MLDYIALYPNEHESEINMEFLTSSHDKPMDYYVIQCMKDFESVKNIKILNYEIIEDQDEVDINRHMININYKKKDLNSIPIPKHIYILDTRYHEIVFNIRVTTNVSQKDITKRILVPTLHDGYYMINGKKMKVIWQLVDASTYSQRGKNTMKSRMPIIIYHNKFKETPDIYGNIFVLPSYSCAQDSSGKARKGSYVSKKKKMKFVNPLMIYAAKMGMKKTIKFFGMDGIVKFKKNYTKKDEDECYIFECNECYITAKKEIFDAYDLVKSFVCMAVNLQNRDFPVEMDLLENREYWTCRIGYIGSVKNKNIYTFLEKGKTFIHMIERLLDVFSIESLRLPDVYKGNVYWIIYWMITEFDHLKERVNIDINNKRIRKNEAIVVGTLGRKIAENINKLIERKTKSKMNTMDTLLELFNFNSDIILTGMRNMNDMVKADDASNDMAFVSDFAFTCKGVNALGNENSKMISDKYRYLHPSMVGVIDLFTTSNSDCGMSGSIVPFVELYDGFFFTPDKEPCKERYFFERNLHDDFGVQRNYQLDTFEDFIDSISTKVNSFEKEFTPEIIEIVEREPEPTVK